MGKDTHTRSRTNLLIAHVMQKVFLSRTSPIGEAWHIIL